MKNKKGFTLIELIATVTILALVVIIAIPAYNSITKSINEKNSTTIREKILTAATKYAADNNLRNNYQLSVTSLITSGYIEADSYEGDANSTAVITNPSDSDDNLACHEVNITVEDYEYYASFTKDENGNEVSDCTKATSVIMDNNYEISAYKVTYTNSNITFNPSEDQIKVNDITNAIDWINKDVLVVVNSKKSEYVISNISFLADTDTKSTNGLNLYTVDKSNTNKITTSEYSKYSNILLVKASTVLTQDWTVRVTATENNESKLREKDFTVQIDKENPTITVGRETGWVSETSGMLITGSDGSGSGVSKVIYYANDESNKKYTDFPVYSNSVQVSLYENTSNETQHFQVVDKAGNYSEIYETKVENVDSSKPEITSVTYDIDTDRDKNIDNRITYDKKITTKITASDSGSGIAKVLTCQISSSIRDTGKKCTPDTEAVYTVHNGIATYDSNFISSTTPTRMCYEAIDNVGHTTDVGCSDYYNVDTSEANTINTSYDNFRTLNVTANDSESGIYKVVCTATNKNNSSDKYTASYDVEDSNKNNAYAECYFSGLSAGQTYNYEVKAYNKSNLVKSVSGSFTTSYTLQKVNSLCDTDSNGYCNSGVYVKYGSYEFVLYRINKDSNGTEYYNVVYTGSDMKASLIDADCCDRGKCHLQYIYDDTVSGIYSNRTWSHTSGSSVQKYFVNLPSNRTSTLQKINYDFGYVSSTDFNATKYTEPAKSKVTFKQENLPSIIYQGYSYDLPSKDDSNVKCYIKLSNDSSTLYGNEVTSISGNDYTVGSTYTVTCRKYNRTEEQEQQIESTYEDRNDPYDYSILVKNNDEEINKEVLSNSNINELKGKTLGYINASYSDEFYKRALSEIRTMYRNKTGYNPSIQAYDTVADLKEALYNGDVDYALLSTGDEDTCDETTCLSKPRFTYEFIYSYTEEIKHYETMKVDIYDEISSQAPVLSNPDDTANVNYSTTSTVKTTNKNMTYTSNYQKLATYGLLTYPEYVTLSQKTYFKNLNNGNSISTILSSAVNAVVYSKNDYASVWNAAYGHDGVQSSMSGIYASKNGFQAITPMRYGANNVAMVLSFKPNVKITSGKGIGSDPFVITTSTTDWGE